MSNENIGTDALIEDIYTCLQENEQRPVPSSQKPSHRPKRRVGRKLFTVLGTALLLVLQTALLLAGLLYGVMFILAKGPSPTARNIFLLSVKETSAVGFLANLFYTDEQIAELTAEDGTVEYVETDTSLIQIPQQQPDDDSASSDAPTADAWGLTDEDGDGIILEEVRGEGYSGYMMVVLDPSRVIMGSIPSSFGTRGYTVEEYVEYYDAVAGINAGGFYDPNGEGNGSIPDSMVVCDGKTYYSELGCRSGFVGFDSQHILHVGKFTATDIANRDIQYGVSFGPILVVNGEIASAALASGVNPRTAIGQRSDGAVLMLVIDGRQVTSLGATYRDLAEIMLSFGAVNACNLDGGSSSMMWYQDGYVNTCASVVGIRPVPTCFLVLKEGDTDA